LSLQELLEELLVQQFDNNISPTRAMHPVFHSFSQHGQYSLEHIYVEQLALQFA
jgi:hypothetical protein